MAYQERYYHQYCDAFGASCRISIQEDNFVGVATELEGQPNPFVLTYESESDFKYDPIRSSSVEIFLALGTGNGVDFQEFWTSDERKFKVEHTIESQLDWVGYVIPDGFGYELKGGVYYVAIQASDGLSNLEAYEFKSDVTNSPYGTQDLTYNNGFEFPFILIATEILKKIGLDLSVWTCVDVYERSMTKTGDTRDADPLATSYANVKTYINDTEREDIPYWNDIQQVWNCREVLENLCHLFGAKVYQSNGTWRIKRVNADVDYGGGSTQRYWRKYNTNAVYLGREIINDDVTVYCDQQDNSMIGNDHILRMDEVYKAFRMNYKYTFKRVGDSPLNLIENGDFSIFDNTSRLAAPEGWTRFRQGNKWHPRLQGVTVDGTEANGFTTGIEMGTQKPGIPLNDTDPFAAVWASLRPSNNIQVLRGDQLYLDFWQRLNRLGDNRTRLFSGLFLIYIEEVKEKEVVYHFLVNETLADPTVKDPSKYPQILKWRSSTAGSGGNGASFLRAAAAYKEGVDYLDYYHWEHCIFEVPECPASGKLIFSIHGLGSSIGKTTKNFPGFPITSDRLDVPFVLEKTVRGAFADTGGVIPRYQITGVFLGFIPESSDLAQQQDFIYENTTGVYTLEKSPIAVYNGDVQDEKHISNIIVPTNVSGKKNFWDTIDNLYGSSSLGLLTVRSIMNQYFEPKRIIEGTIKQDNLTFNTRYEFDFLPGLKFVLQRGSFNRKLGYLEDAMFVQITQGELPQGGTEGGNNTLANYQFTGRTRCQKNVSNLNTGFLEFEEIDQNPNSETYGQIRWIDDDIPATGCVLGEPNNYYWGADFSSYDVNNLTSVGYLEDTGEVQCPFDNDGTGKYLFFIHRDTLGLVEQVETEEQPEIISDWNYLADTIIDGFNYKVLRMNYITAEFYSFNITFKFT